MKGKTILTILIVSVFVLTGCSTDNASEVQQEQTEAVEKIDTEIVTEATEVIEEEIPLELTAQNPSIELNVGEQNKLLYTANRDADLTYSSSDETIATVDENGIVTAVGGGTATITAMSEGVSCEWTVESIPPEFAAYKEFIEGEGYKADLDDYVFYFGAEFAVLDLNNDGVFDLIIEALQEGGVHHNGYYIYTFKNGKVTCCDWHNDLIKYDPEQQVCVTYFYDGDICPWSFDVLKINSDLSFEETDISYGGEELLGVDVGDWEDLDIIKTYGKYWILTWSTDECLNKLESDYFISEQYITDQINGNRIDE